MKQEEIVNLLGEEAAASLESQTAHEKFNDTLEKAKDTFKRFVDGEYLDKFSNLMANFLEKWQRDGLISAIFNSGGDISDNAYVQSLPENSSERRRAENDAAGIVTAVEQGDKMASGGIVTRRKNNVTIGEAGPEAVVPLTAFYAKIDELIAAVNKGGNVYMDSTKVGTSFAISTREV